MKSLSLRKYFHDQTVKWSLIGLGMAALFSIPCVLYSQKLSSEREILVLSKSVSRAFRPMILDDNIRDAEFQIRRAIGLKDDESVVVRGPDLKAVYPINQSDNVIRCKASMKPCHVGINYMSVLYPIYFNEQRKDLYGYLELTIHPAFDSTAIVLLIPLLTASFFTLALGLSSALNQSSKRIISVLSTWANHLRYEPQVQLTASPAAPYVEFESMKEAIDGLYSEIGKLKTETARVAKIDGQLALLREISHDLRTPHSLLAKYFALIVDTVKTTGQLKPTEVTNMENTLRRMGDILRQVRVSPTGNGNGGETEIVCDLEAECPAIVDDLKSKPEVLAKRAQITMRVDHTKLASISKTALYRILDNLVSNAVEAVKQNEGQIEVEVIDEEGLPTLVVRDNGHGIPVGIRDKIFDFDFTTNFARGTGLGLGIVSKICQEFDAKVNFVSAEDVGTEFKVTFRKASISDIRKGLGGPHAQV